MAFDLDSILTPLSNEANTGYMNINFEKTFKQMVPWWARPLAIDYILELRQIDTHLQEQRKDKDELTKTKDGVEGWAKCYARQISNGFDTYSNAARYFVNGYDSLANLPGKFFNWIMGNGPSYIALVHTINGENMADCVQNAMSIQKITAITKLSGRIKLDYRSQRPDVSGLNDYMPLKNQENRVFRFADAMCNTINYAILSLTDRLSYSEKRDNRIN